MAWLITILAVAVAAGARWLLDPYLGDQEPFIVFYVSVIVAAWAGGMRTALLATVLGLLLAFYIFVPPRYELAFNTPADQISCVLYLLVSFGFIGFSEAMLRARRHADLRREELRVTLASIGDAVITTDTTGRVTYMNGAAESLTDWKLDEAVGKPLREVSMLRDEQTDEQLPSLGIRALREGRVLGLTHPTVLVSKDGNRRPIDETAAPIRDARSNIVGAVLVARDITDEREAEKKVYGLLRELRDADRKKDEFLAILAHELRGPLAPLVNMLELIKRGGRDPELLQQTAPMMERQLQHMIRLIDDLLDVNRISRGKIELRCGRVELASVVHHVLETCEPLVADAGQQLQVEVPPEPVYVDGDPVRLTQIFSNLLINACKYTPRGGQIWLTVEPQDSQVVVQVRDTGAGIPADMLGRIFEMFTQVHPGLEGSQQGLGIGLSLVRRLVELHGGSVEAHSDGPGKGSRFTVRLPMLRDASEPAITDTVRDFPRVTSRNILVVDDNRMSALSLAALLKGDGNDTRTAHDGVEAVQLAEDFRPDVVLLDIGLPKLNGYQVARRIREQPWGKNAVLVALSGWGQEDDRRKSLAAGFDHHMVKPLDYATFMRLLSADRSHATLQEAAERSL